MRDWTSALKSKGDHRWFPGALIAQFPGKGTNPGPSPSAGTHGPRRDPLAGPLGGALAGLAVDDDLLLLEVPLAVPEGGMHGGGGGFGDRGCHSAR